METWREFPTDLMEAASRASACSCPALRPVEASVLTLVSSQAARGQILWMPKRTESGPFQRRTAQNVVGNCLLGMPAFGTFSATTAASLHRLTLHRAR